MAQASWPFENIDVTETQFSKWARHIGEGVNGGPTTTALLVTGDSSGMQVRVAAGEAMVRGHYYSSTVQETITIPAQGAQDSRIDAIVLELNPVNNEIVLNRVQGTAAPSNPQPPALTKTDASIYHLLLAYVLIRPNITEIEPSDVTDRRTYIYQTAKNDISPLLLIGA